MEMITETTAPETTETTTVDTNISNEIQGFSGGAFPKSFYLTEAIITGAIGIISLIIAIIMRKKRKNKFVKFTDAIPLGLAIPALIFAIICLMAYLYH